MQSDDIFTIDTEHTHVNDNLIDHSTQCIKSLYEKYGHDLFLTSKIQHYISVQLPMIIANVEESRQRSIERITELNAEQESFMNSFLYKHPYFYVSSNEKFFSYDGVHFKESNEDHILHHIVTSISRQRNILMEWKHKTKVSTLKKIKDQPVFKCVPESTTIQNVIQLLLPYFQTKKEVKYFLTIIGDNILKKDLSLIHFINPSIKHIIREINNRSVFYFNVQCTQTFKFKCHEKHYDMDNKLCRLVPVAETMDDFISEYFQQSVLDILCVACHYSNRYNQSDDFLKIYNSNDKITSYVMKLCNTTPEKMLEEFANEYLYVIGDSNSVISSSPMDHYIIQCCPETKTDSKVDMMTQQISWKSMLYLWKDFLRIHKYPLNLFQPLCKQILTSVIFAKYFDESRDAFTGIGSSKMPIIYRFLKFWSDTMINDMEDHVELEIDEINELFTQWCSTAYTKKRMSLTEEEIIDILKYYYPELDIEQNKYIYKKRCILWDKDMDIDTAVTTLKEECIESHTKVTLYDAYVYYCKVFHNKICVSKSYFEKYVSIKYNYVSDSDTGLLIFESE